MKLELKIQLLKFCSALFNSVFVALGLGVAACGIWILFGSTNFLSAISISSVELRTVAAGLMFIGAVVVVVGFVGCIGAQTEQRLLLLIYLGFLIILVLGQLFVTLLLFINRAKIEQGLEAAVDKIIVEFGGNNSLDTLMDNVQHYGKCCGKDGSTDWLKNSFIHSLNETTPVVLPCSCFSSFNRSSNSSLCSDQPTITDPQFGQGNNLFDQGCKQTLSDWLQENALTIIGMDVSLILIQVLQFSLIVDLYKSIGRKTDQVAESDHTPLDHDPTDDLDDAE